MHHTMSLGCITYIYKYFRTIICIKIKENITINYLKSITRYIKQQ